MIGQGQSARVDVLIADDDAPTRWLLRNLLEQRGFTCAEAEDGPGAVALAQAAPPRCVLLDLAMPGLDGLAVARRLRADPHTRSAHIHCLTGQTAPEARAQARDAGCEEFLLKPIEPVRLLELIHRNVAPPEQGWLGGLTLAAAGDLLDWLERHGCTELTASWQGEAGFAVCCVCPPGLRLGREATGAIRLFSTATAETDFVCPSCGVARPVLEEFTGWAVRCDSCLSFGRIPEMARPAAAPRARAWLARLAAAVGGALRRAAAALRRSR